MARVVVLDSCSDTADRVRQALQADAAQQATRVEVAANQSQALRLLQSQETTALLTDLLAANGDAIGFLSQVCQQSPPVPVIMLTSAANEDLAVQALRTGATSYIPKRLLEEELYETVQSVLALASHHRSRLRVLECMEHWSAEFTLENDRFLIPPLVRYLQDAAYDMHLVSDDSAQMRLGVALEESLLNGVYHGNLEVPSTLREQDDDTFYRAVEERSQQAPYCRRKLYVSAEMSRREGRFVVRDEGPGFDVQSVPDPTDPGNVDRVCGRGLLLMRTFMDEVTFNAAGNQVVMVIRAASLSDSRCPA